MLKRSSKLLWMLLAFFTIALAFVVSVARLFFPLFDQYRGDIERWATEELGRPVKVHEIVADWGRWQPRIRIKGVDIYTKEGSRVWVKLEEVQLYFRLFESLRYRRLRAGTLNIVGADIDVKYANGEYSIGGVPVERESHLEENKLLHWLTQREKFVITHSRINWDDKRVSPEVLKLHQIDFLAAIQPGRYSLRGEFRLKRQIDSRLRFMLDLEGNIFRPRELKHRFHMSGNTTVGQWINKQLLANTQVKDGAVEFRVWGEGRGQLEQLAGDVDFEDLQWTRHVAAETGALGKGADRPFAVDKLSGNFKWQRRAAGWWLSVRNIVWVRRGQEWPGSRLYLEYTEPPNGKSGTLRGTVQFIRMEDLGHLLLSALPLQNEVRKIWADLDPKGDVSNVVFESPTDKENLTNYYLAADFERLTVNAWEQMPALENIKGRVVADARSGHVQLDSGKSLIHLPSVFAGPIQFEKLRGKVLWSHSDKGVRVASDDMIAENADVKTRSQFKLDWVAGAIPFLTLKTSFSDGIVDQYFTYVPVKILKPPLLNWLKKSIHKGTLDSGALVYQGYVNEFPFDRNNGIFDVQLNVRDTELDFHPLWPKIEGIDASLRFVGRGLSMQIHRAHTRGMELLPARLGITTLDRNALLKFDGSMLGDTNNLINYLGAMPVRNQATTFLKRFEGKGAALLNINLTLPLLKVAERSFAGRVEFIDSAFRDRLWNFEIGGLNGRLNFASHGDLIHFDLQQMLGKLNRRDVIVSADSHANAQDKSVSTEIKVLTRMSVVELMGEYASLAKGLVRGEADWRMALTIQQRRDLVPKISVSLGSKLVGVEVNLPQGFGKTFAHEHPFLLEADLSHQQLNTFSLQYGQWVNSLFTVTHQGGVLKLDRGEIRFGGEKARMPETAGIRLIGRLDTFSVSKWIDWIERKKMLKTRSENLFDSVVSLDLYFKRLELVGNTVNDVSVRVQRHATHWLAQVAGKEIAGNLRIPVHADRHNPLVAELTHLSIHESIEDRSHKHELPDPRKMPALQITSDHFYFNDVYQGRLKISATSNNQGMHFDSLDMESKHLVVKATGDWMVTNRAQMCSFVITAQSDNVGKALAERNYGVNMDRGQGQATVKAHWEGPPSWFQLKEVNGSLEISISKGRIIDINPRAGKLLGMFSLYALPRRLSLDFSDVFKKGFSFDKIQGKFVVSKGDAFTNDFVMEGPAVKIAVAGRVGLANKDYEQTIHVTPKFSGNLPIVGGLAAGPQVGIGLWVADQMLGKTLNRMTTSHYSLEGTWEKPIIKKLRKQKRELPESPQEESLN